MMARPSANEMGFFAWSHLELCGVSCYLHRCKSPRSLIFGMCVQVPKLGFGGESQPVCCIFPSNLDTESRAASSEQRKRKVGTLPYTVKELKGERGKIQLNP